MFVSFIVFCGLAALAVFAYVSGSTLAEREVVNLRTELDQTRKLLQTERTDKAQLAAEKERAQTRAREWEERYEREVPTGRTRDLVAELQSQLASGVDHDRLRFMIAAAGNKDSCDGQPATKRFLVRTPISAGVSDSVGFADSTITVTADGESAVNAEGKPEAWFDAKKSIAVRFTALGGKVAQISGLLPLHHSIAQNDSEYRFSIVEGERKGFIKVTADRCKIAAEGAAAMKQ